MIDRVLGHYRVVEKIGAGGMGEVYRAHDERLDRDVALKVLPPGTLGAEGARRRFRKEARALSRLNHPNIATVHDFDSGDDVDFLVMELIPGSNLRQRLESRPLSEKEVLTLGVQLVQGLMAAHRQGVIHRDLKPGNLQLTPDGRLKILDFGLARLQLLASDTATTDTRSEGQGVGTPPYMAPEQLRGEEVDGRTDIYAAGAVLYEMATGRRPFAGSGPGLAYAILHQPPPPPRELNARLSPALQTIILKALDKDPERRYESAKELLVALEHVGSSGVGTAAGPRWSPALAALLAVTAAGGGWLVLHRGWTGTDAASPPAGPDVAMSPPAVVAPWVRLNALPWARLTLTPVDSSVQLRARPEQELVTPVALALPEGDYVVGLENGGITPALTERIRVEAGRPNEFLFTMPSFNAETAREWMGP